MRNRSAFDPRVNEFLFDYSVSIRFFQFPSRKKKDSSFFGIFSLELLLVPFLLGNFFRREDEGEMMDILISSILKRETMYSQDVDARKYASSRYNCREYG